MKGRAVLIQKNSAKGTVTSNYRLTACLPLKWKLLPGIFADKICFHFLNNNVLNNIDQFLFDKVVLGEARRKKVLECGMD